jgi:hypothetical protein
MMATAEGVLAPWDMEVNEKYSVIVYTVSGKV